MKRELAGAVAIPIVLAILFLGPPILFNALVALVALGAVWEFYRIAEKTGHPVAKTVGLAASALLLGGAALLWGPFGFETPGGNLVDVAVKTRPCFWFVAALATVFLAAIAPLAAEIPPAAALAGAASTMFGIVSIALPATAMCLLRARSPRAVLMLLLIVWVCDSCAYYFGRSFGRQPLAPIVSPKKTWEGTLAGLAGATIFAAAAGTWWFLPELGPPARRAGRGARLDGGAGRETWWNRSGSAAPA